MRAIIVSSNVSQARIFEETKLQAPNQIGEICPHELVRASNYIVELTERNKELIEEAKLDWSTLVYR